MSLGLQGEKIQPSTKPMTPTHVLLRVGVEGEERWVIPSGAQELRGESERGLLREAARPAGGNEGWHSALVPCSPPSSYLHTPPDPPPSDTQFLLSLRPTGSFPHTMVPFYGRRKQRSHSRKRSLTSRLLSLGFPTKSSPDASPIDWVTSSMHPL